MTVITVSLVYETSLRVGFEGVTDANPVIPVSSWWLKVFFNTAVTSDAGSECKKDHT